MVAVPREAVAGVLAPPEGDERALPAAERAALDRVAPSDVRVRPLDVRGDVRDLWCVLERL